MAQKYEELQVEALSMVNDPRYRFYDFEGQFNKAGYRLMSNDQIEGATFVFTLNTKLYPDSANAWDSLAESYWKAKNNDKAIEYYNKAIQLDPDGVTGDNSREMLEKVKMGMNERP